MARVDGRPLLRAAAVGAELPVRHERVTARRAMAFAAGIGALRSCYFTEAPAMAPPSFIVALEWPLLDGAAYRSAIGADQPLMQRAIHVSQATRFHRPIRVGDGVSTSGRIVAARQTRIGVLLVTRLETRTDDGLPVAESRFASITLGTALDGEPAHLETPPEPPPPLDAAAETGEAIVTSPALPHVYTACSGIWNPIHTEPAAAAAAGLPSLILHGTCIWAIAIERLVDSCCAGDPSRLRQANAAFQSPIVPGDVVYLQQQSGAAPEYVDFGIRDAQRRALLRGTIAVDPA
jgi:acyl dehydratase